MTMSSNLLNEEVSNLLDKLGPDPGVTKLTEYLATQQFDLETIRDDVNSSDGDLMDIVDTKLFEKLKNLICCDGINNSNDMHKNGLIYKDGDVIEITDDDEKLGNNLSSNLQQLNDKKEDEEVPCTIINQICHGVCKYYESLSHPYPHNLFCTYCEEEEFDEDAMDELDEDAKLDDCGLLEFYKVNDQDAEFPFNNEYKGKDKDEKQQYIFHILQQCKKNKLIQFMDGEVFKGGDEIIIMPNENEIEIKDDAEYSSESNSDQSIDSNMSQNTQQTECITEDDEKKEQIELTGYTRVIRIDMGLSRYYRSLNQSYNRDFYNYCNEQEYMEEENFDVEIENDVNDCGLIEFHINDDKEETFPFNDKWKNKDNDEKTEYIYHLIKQCDLNENILFENGEMKTAAQYPPKMEMRDEHKAEKKEQMEEEVDNPIIKQIDDNWKEYYTARGKKYNHKFAVWCEDNDIDDSRVDDEIITDGEVLKFDEANFPFPEELKNESKMNQLSFILQLIKKFRIYPDLTFDVPDFMLDTFSQKHMFSIELEELATIREKYRVQCPVLWHDGLSDDATCLLLLAIGIKHNYPYFMFLVDDYNRRRVAFEDGEQQKKQLKEKKNDATIDDTAGEYSSKQWVKENAHVKEVEISNIIINKDKMIKYLATSSQTDGPTRVRFEMPATGGELLQQCPGIYAKRLSPKFIFKVIQYINGSLEMTCRYFAAAVGFIKDIIRSNNQTATVTCPFQVYVPDTTEVTLNQDLTGVIEEDEDSDDEDSAVKGEITNEQAQLREMLVNGYWRPKIDKIIPEALVNLMIGFVGNIPIYIDYFGDIESKLTKNDLRYHKLTQKKDRNYEYIQYIASKNLFAKPFKTFKEKFQDEPSYPHQRRFCVMVDLRNEDTDSIYFYEPPANCRNIPTDPVPEWGISASRTSLLPNKEYDPWKAEHSPTNTVTGPNANVTVTSHCKGRLLTFSFQVIQKDEIRCYCYWNGQAFRFDPSDLKNVLFKIFDRDDEKNESFLEDGVDDLLNRMKENGYDLCDKSFWGFEKWCDGQTD